MSDSRLANIPACLQAHAQWVGWRFEPPETEGSKPSKVPVNIRTGRRASATDPGAWTTYAQVLAAYENDKALDGIGFVFTIEDPFCGVDLDNCLDAQGHLTWGQDIIASLETYTEISPSGRGVKLFLEGKKPDFAGCGKKGLGPDGNGGIEVYDHSRYFTVTGKGTPSEVADRQAELETLCERFWSPAPPTPVAATPRHAAATDDRVQECLRKILGMRLTDRNDGSHRLFSAACRCVEHDLSDAEALQCLRLFEQVSPFPLRRSDEQLLDRVRHAERRCQRGSAWRGPGPATSEPAPAAEIIPMPTLLAGHPSLRAPLIHGVLRSRSGYSRSMWTTSSAICRTRGSPTSRPARWSPS